MDTLDRRTALQLSAAVALMASLPAANAQATTGRIEGRLKQLGIDLPASGPAPVANYVPTLRHHGVIYVAGQIPFKAPGELLFRGRVGGELTLGRSGNCAIGLPDDTFASGLHARVFRRDGAVWVEDLGSTNGTHLNGGRLDAAQQLAIGDRLQVGSTIFEAQ